MIHSLDPKPRFPDDRSSDWPKSRFCSEKLVSLILLTRQGKTVLVQLRNSNDPETGERYTVKRYESEKVRDGDSWRHTTITLKPFNPDFESIVLTGEEGQLQVIAELLEVLGGGG